MSLTISLVFLANVATLDMIPGYTTPAFATATIQNNNTANNDTKGSSIEIPTTGSLDSKMVSGANPSAPGVDIRLTNDTSGAPNGFEGLSSFTINGSNLSSQQQQQ